MIKEFKYSFLRYSIKLLMRKAGSNLRAYKKMSYVFIDIPFVHKTMEVFLTCCVTIVSTNIVDKIRTAITFWSNSNGIYASYKYEVL
jgi:hypothetical protein